MDFVSVLIPVKNGGATLGRTLDSLRKQTYQHFEVIVIDGGSTDNTLEVLGAAALSNLHLISDPGGGIPGAVNKGLRAARGDVLVPWLCADDYLDSRFIETIVRSLKEEGDFAYGNWHGVDEGVIIKSRTPDLKWHKKIRYVMPRVMPNSFVFRRKVFEKVGFLNEQLKYSCDYDFLRRVQAAGLRGIYSADAWYYYQTGGLSQARFLDCAREIAKTAILHGGPIVPTYVHFGKAYIVVNLSFVLNSMRKQWRTIEARMRGGFGAH